LTLLLFLKDNDDDEDSLYDGRKNINDLFMKKAKEAPAFKASETRFNQGHKNLSPGPGEYKENN